MVFEAIEMILGGMDEEDPEGRKAFFQLGGLFEMQFGGSYKLDNGNGLEDTSDDTHRWEVGVAIDASGRGRSCDPRRRRRRRHDALRSLRQPRRHRGQHDDIGAPLHRRRRRSRVVWASPTDVLDAALDEDRSRSTRFRPSFRGSWTRDLSARVFLDEIERAGFTRFFCRALSAKAQALVL